MVPLGVSNEANAPGRAAIIRVSAPGQKLASLTNASEASTLCPDYVNFVEQDGDRLVWVAALEFRQLRHRCVVIGAGGEAVDRVGWDRHDPAAEHPLDHGIEVVRAYDRHAPLLGTPADGELH